MTLKTERRIPTNGRTRPPAAGRSVRATVLHALLEDAEHGVLLVDREGRVSAINDSAARLLGVGPSRARGRRAADLVRSVIQGDDPVGDALRSARAEREIVLVGARGGEVPVLMRTRRFSSPGGALVTLRDLTRERRLQEELRRRERLATLGQLSAGVAHEIRNPLAGIGTSAQVLLRRFEPRDERARFVRVILDEVGRLDRIVTSLLQYARPRAPELVYAALAPCVERVVDLSRDALTQAGVVVEVHAAPRLAPIHHDPDLVVQVLLNVTLNAIQAMPDGGSLRYDVRRVRRRAVPRGPGRRTSDRSVPTSGRGAWVDVQQVRVVDSGSGMSRGVLAKLFDPFFSTKPKGTGLGLAISQTIVQEHGGTIEVASREGRGTTVMLNFPLEKRHGERRDPNADAGHARPARR